MKIVIAVVLLGCAAPVSMAQMPGRPARPSVASLVQQLKDPDSETRLEAATRLGLVRGDEQKAAVPALLQALETDKEAAVRMKAIDALRQIGEASKPTVPTLIRALADADWRVKVSAVHALVALQPEGRDGAKEIRRLLTHAEPAVRFNAAVGLVRLGVPAEDAAPLLREGMKDASLANRAGAAALLVRAIGPERARPEVMPLIEEGLASNEIGAVRASLTALVRLGPSSSLPRIVAVAKSDRDEEVRLAAVRALVQMGEAARPALPDLMQVSKEKGAVGAAATRAVRWIGEGRRPEPGRRGRPAASGDRHVRPGGSTAPFPVPSPSAPHDRREQK